MKNLVLKNNFGEVSLDPIKLNLSSTIRKSIKKVKDAKFESKNATIFSKNGEKYKHKGTPLFFENQDVYITFLPYDSFKDHSFSLFVNGNQIFQSKKISNRSSLSGNINFKDSVGYTNLVLRDETLEEDIFTIETEVFPQKIDYKTDFYLMLKEITEIIYNLAFDYLNSTYLKTSLRDESQKKLNEWIIILKYLFDNLTKSLDLILKNPNYKIVPTKKIKDVSQVRKVDRKVNKWVLKNKKYLKYGNSEQSFKIKNQYVCTCLPESKKKISYNTFENRFIVWSLKQIILKINEVEKQLLSFDKKNTYVENDLEVLTNYRRRLYRRLNDRYFNEVKDFNKKMNFSTVLTMAPGYKDFYYNFLLLRKGLSLTKQDIFNINLKDIFTLYEYWCFLKTIKILKEDGKYDLANNDFIKIEHNKFLVGLKKGNKSKVEFVKKDTKEKIEIFYNKRFNTPTYNQQPDNFIEFRKKGYNLPFRYIFDAKYRFDKEPGYNEDASSYISNGPPLDTIGQLHRYRDAILEKDSSEQTYAQVIKSLGGIILFPFPDKESKFKKHRFYKSISKVNIGALPLQPGKKNILFKKFLDNLFGKTAERNFEQMINYDKSEYENFINDIKTPVLIGMIRKKLNKKRIKYLKENLKFYIHKTTNPYISQIKYVVLYNQKTRKIIGYSKVKDIYYGNNKGLIQPTQEEYLFFSLKNIKELNIDFSFASLGQTGYFFTNYFVFNKFLEENDKDILKLNNLQNIRIWQEIKNLNLPCKITREAFQLDKNQVDISPIKIKFNFREREFTCKQDNENKKIFYINNKKYDLKGDLENFLKKNFQT